jgi:hypothetical protein
MIGFIAAPLLLALIVAGRMLVRSRRRRGRESWSLLHDLGPVSSQWMADYRRLGLIPRQLRAER